LGAIKQFSPKLGDFPKTGSITGIFFFKRM